jgi:hypothetical protein
MLHACALAAAARLPHKVTMRALSTQSSFSGPGSLRTCLTVASLISHRLCAIQSNFADHLVSPAMLALLVSIHSLSLPFRLMKSDSTTMMPQPRSPYLPSSTDLAGGLGVSRHRMETWESGENRNHIQVPIYDVGASLYGLAAGRWDER